MSVCIVDSSILCEILRVPNTCGDHETVYAKMKEKIEEREDLLLPMSAIIETGNHIGQNGDGRQRRSTAERFIQFVKQAVQGESPFTTTPLFKQEALLDWLGEFPEWTKRRSGLGDLTIVKTWETQCELNPMRRVYIWSTDGHLSSYDRKP